ncbi:hypothetical protein FIBSPDRAFT_551862 [Athelia psychrophila]|uniref:Uncharacterized protein n=1 Tax=Athelia psychrophila TaxID=1759441 RepID=A0A166UVA1_9AGAM|nr:hypothetical protein FIBSPDRAFT_551862 [Fibularhizoctonia sp. CBS 109695]
MVAVGRDNGEVVRRDRVSCQENLPWVRGRDGRVPCAEAVSTRAEAAAATMALGVHVARPVLSASRVQLGLGLGPRLGRRGVSSSAVGASTSQPGASSPDFPVTRQSGKRRASSALLTLSHPALSAILRRDAGRKSALRIGASHREARDDRRSFPLIEASPSGALRRCSYSLRGQGGRSCPRGDEDTLQGGVVLEHAYGVCSPSSDLDLDIIASALWVRVD